MFSGSIVALVTPMDESGNIDYVGLKKLVDFHVNSGTNAIVSVGTTGESSTLTEEEHINVVLKTVEFAGGRIPIIAGSGANSTQEAIFYSKVFMGKGVAGCLSVVPYYNKPSQEGLYQHFKAIAEASDLPHLLYNVPGRTVTDMQPETVARLAEIDNIIGIKDATGDLTRVAKHREHCGDDFLLFSGDDLTGLEFIKLGGHGVISVTNNVAAAQMSQMMKLALAGDFEKATEIDNKIATLHTNLFVEANPIPVKWALQQLGLIDHASLRLPLTSLDQALQGKVKQALVDAGLL